jgi:ABC-2 type transport system permease protein
MRELLIVMQREFWERVRTRSFILSTLLTPIFLIAVTAGPALLAQRDFVRDVRLIIVDDGAGGFGEAVAERLRDGDGATGSFIVSVAPGPLTSISDSLASLVRTGRLDAYLHLPASESDEEQRATIWSESQIRSLDRTRIRNAMTAARQEALARELGLDAADVRELLAPAPLDEVRLTEDGDEQQAGIRMAAGFAGSFILYFLILFYGVHVLRSAQEEKSNRISEILVSSVKPGNLMLGKVLGVGCTALLQVGTWAAMIAALMVTPLMAFMSVTRTDLATVVNAIPVMGIVVLGIFVVLGFFLYATLFAALGAAAETMEDAQRFTMPLTMPLFIPILLSERIANGAGDTLAVVLSWIPLTAPLVVPVRVFAGAASPFEVIVSVIWMMLSIMIVGWIAGRIYRSGILSTGRRRGWRDIGRWVRAR